MAQTQTDSAADKRNLPSPQALSAVERFDGYEDAHAWLESMNTMADLYKWTENICLRVVKLRFKGIAQRWIARRKFDDWDDFEEQFLRRFGETRESALARLNSCWQSKYESPKAFADRFLEDAERAGRTEDEALVLQFLGKLRPDLRKEAARRRPQSIDEIVDFCNYWLGAMAEEFEPNHPRARRYDSPYRSERQVTFADRIVDDDDNSYRLRRQNPEGFENRRPAKDRFDRDNGRWFNDRPRDRVQPRWNDRPLVSNNNNNRSFRPFNRDNTRDSRPAPPVSDRGVPAAAPKATSPADIEALTKSFQRMELNMNQLMQDKDKEIRHLRYALQQQGRPTQQTPQFNYLAASTQNQSQHESTDDEADSSDSNDGTPAGPSMLNLFQTTTPYTHDTTTGDSESYFEDDSENYTEDLNPENHSVDIDPEYLNMLYHGMYAKHGRDSNDVYQRMPHKRVAFNPVVSPYTPGLRQQSQPASNSQTTNMGGTHNPTTATTPKQTDLQRPGRMPRDRVFFDVPPSNSTPGPSTTTTTKSLLPKPNTGPYSSTQTPSRPRPRSHSPAPATAPTPQATPRASATSNGPSQAARLANDKGREMANQLRQNLKFEACQDPSLTPQAVLTCLAGHLANDPRLIELGQNMARHSEAVVQKLSPNRRPGSNRPAASDANRHTSAPKMNSMQKLALNTPAIPINMTAKAARRWYKRAHTAAPCAVIARINGKEIEAVVDTGACTTAVTEDCLRRLNLLDTINSDIQWPYYNADGRPTAGVGVATGLQLGLGSVTRMINPCITKSQTYDMLIGADLLQRLRCRVDVGEKQISYQVNVDQWETAPLIEPTPRCLEPCSNINYLVNLPDNYVQAAAPYYDPPAPHKGATSTNDIDLIGAWWNFAGEVFDLPPEPSTTPGWKRCVSNNDHHQDSHLYEKMDS